MNVVGPVYRAREGKRLGNQMAQSSPAKGIQYRFAVISEAPSRFYKRKLPSGLKSAVLATLSINRAMLRIRMYNRMIQAQIRPMQC